MSVAQQGMPGQIQDLTNVIKGVEEKVRKRGDAVKTLLNGYTKSVEVIVDVTELLKKYKTMANEVERVVAQYNAVGTELGKILSLDDLKQVQQETALVIKDLQEKAQASLKTIRDYMPESTKAIEHAEVVASTASRVGPALGLGPSQGGKKAQGRGKKQ